MWGNVEAAVCSAYYFHTLARGTYDGGCLLSPAHNCINSLSKAGWRSSFLWTLVVGDAKNLLLDMYAMREIKWMKPITLTWQIVARGIHESSSNPVESPEIARKTRVFSKLVLEVGSCPFLFGDFPGAEKQAGLG